MKVRRNHGRKQTSMKFEDWIRQHVTTERLKRVESELTQESLYPPIQLFDFSGHMLLTEIVYRIHHESFKAIAFSEAMAKTSLEQFIFLFFGETTEDTPYRVTFLKQTFLKHLRSRQSSLYNYFIVVEKANKRLEEWRGEHFNIKKD